MRISRFNSKRLAKPIGFSHVVKITGLKEAYYISGQLPVDSERRVVSTSFDEQAVAAFENLRMALGEADLNFSNVVKINVFLTDMKNLARLQEVRKKFLPKDGEPATTTVGTSALAVDGCLLEVEAVAVK